MFTRNYRLLAYFVEVVDCGSIRGAARRLFVSAPVVSKAIADLEGTLNSSLLIRDRQRLTPTEDGRRVYAYALRMSHAAVDALASVNRPDGSLQGNVDINLPTELASAWLPAILKSFRREFPEVTTSIFASDQLERENAQQQQIVIRADYSLREPESGDLYFATLPLCVAYHPDLQGRDAASARTILNAMPFIGFTQSDQSGKIAALDTQRNRNVTFEVHSSTWVNSAQLIRDLVHQGYGAGLLTRQSLQQDLESGRLVEIDRRYHFGYIGLQLRFRDQYPSAAARAFQAHLENLHRASE